MTRTSVEGAATPAPGTPAWASMIAADTGVPAFEPEQLAAAASESPPALLAGAAEVAGHLFGDDIRQPGMHGGEIIRRGISGLRVPHRLVSGLAGRARRAVGRTQCGNGPSISCQTSQSPASSQTSAAA